MLALLFGLTLFTGPFKGMRQIDANPRYLYTSLTLNNHSGMAKKE